MVLRRRRPGTSVLAGSDDPAASFDSGAFAISHTFDRDGDYTLTVVATWSGTYDWAGAGLGGTGNLGALDVTISRGYHVNQARSVLVSPG